MRRQDVVPRFGDRTHHAIGANGDDAVHFRERDRLRAECARAKGIERSDDIADESAILRAVGRKAGQLVAASDDGVGRALDLAHLVAVEATAPRPTSFGYSGPTASIDGQYTGMVKW
jgi:hypothetical protein